MSRMGLSLPEVTVSIFSASSSSAATPTSNRSGLALLGIIAVVSLSSATGCVARVRTRAYVQPATVTYQASAPVVYEEEPTVYVESVPVDIESHPRVMYRGSYVYYVDGRWYAPSARGWVYYRSEPRALVTHRVDFERRYPRTVVRTDVHPHVEVQTRGHVEAHPRVEVETRGRVEAHPRVEVETHKKKRR
jgi:hypothetical protein